MSVLGRCPLKESSPFMKISGCPGLVSVAQRSEYRYVDSDTLGSIFGWGSQIFRVYKWETEVCLR